MHARTIVKFLNRSAVRAELARTATHRELGYKIQGVRVWRFEAGERGRAECGVQRWILTMARSRRIGCEAAREWQWQFGERAIDRAGRFGLIDRVTRGRE